MFVESEKEAYSLTTIQLRRRDLKSSKKSKSKKFDTFKVTLYKDFDDDMEDDVGEALIEFDDHDSDIFDLSYYIGVSTLLKGILMPTSHH